MTDSLQDCSSQDSLFQNSSALGIDPSPFTEPRKTADHSPRRGRQLLCHRPLRTQVASDLIETTAGP